MRSLFDKTRQRFGRSSGARTGRSPEDRLSNGDVNCIAIERAREIDPQVDALGR